MTDPCTPSHHRDPKPYMTCREVLDFLMTYLDGELSPQQRAEFDRHLGVCPSCVNYLDTYKSTIRIGKAALNNDADCGSVPEELVKAIRATRLKNS